MVTCPLAVNVDTFITYFFAYERLLELPGRRITTAAILLMRINVRINSSKAMRTTLELPDPLFARLKARAASEQITLKQLLQSYVEQGLMAPTHSATPTTRSASQLPKVEGCLAFDSSTASNADLFDLLEP